MRKCEINVFNDIIIFLLPEHEPLSHFHIFTSLHRLVKEGDTVSMGDDVCNVQSDKVSHLSGMIRSNTMHLLFVAGLGS